MAKSKVHAKITIGAEIYFVMGQAVTRGNVEAMMTVAERPAMGIGWRKKEPICTFQWQHWLKTN